MIGLLEGTWDGEVLLTRCGVGYEVEPIGDIAAGEEVRLWVHTHMTEAATSLYGFTAAGDRQLFRVLIRLQGVGPKAAAALVRDVGLSAIVAAVADGDAKALTQAAGIGPKSASRILAALADADLPDADGGSAPAGDALVELLTGPQLGFARDVARAAAEQARRSHPDDPDAQVRVAIAAAASGTALGAAASGAAA